MDLAHGVKDVALTPQKAKRRSALTAVRQLETILAEKRVALVKAEATYLALNAEVGALSRAYELVKPQPRTRKKEGK